MPLPESPAVLVVSPHPDDESIGAPATLRHLRQRGWRAVNLAVSLGEPQQHERRLGELREACERAGFEHRLVNPPVALSSGDGMDDAEHTIAYEVLGLLTQLQPQIVVGPNIHDLHHEHEVVGRGIKRAFEMTESDIVWWMWNIWGHLPFPNLYVPFADDTLEAVLYNLAAYEGENARNDYRGMVRGRALLNSVQGSELVFGFGAQAASPQPYAEVLYEVAWSDGNWIEGKHRILDPDNPLVPLTGVKVDWWMNKPSDRAMYVASKLAPQ